MKPMCSNSCSFKYYSSVVPRANELRWGRINWRWNSFLPRKKEFQRKERHDPGTEAEVQRRRRRRASNWRKKGGTAGSFFASLFTQNWPPLKRSDNWMTLKASHNHWYCNNNICLPLAPVLQKLGSAIHRIKCYPVINAIGFQKAYPSYPLDKQFAG